MRHLGAIALFTTTIVGVFALAYPFVVSALPLASGSPISHVGDASLLLAFVVAGSVLVAVSEVSRGPAAGNLSRSIALLGTLVAIDATLRLIPSFLGASPIFALIILVGYVFGAPFGFVMGALTLLLSAAITAGVGPWLPYQMLCAGWIGMTAGWLPHHESPKRQIGIAAAFGALTGLAYGALLNLYSWPFAAPGLSADVGLYWTPTLSFMEGIDRYRVFYLTTSLFHDMTRSIANVVLIAIAGGPVIRLLQRFHTRAIWSSPVQV